MQLNWPDAETGMPKEEQNKACTVLSNYVEKGKSTLKELNKKQLNYHLTLNDNNIIVIFDR